MYSFNKLNRALIALATLVIAILAGCGGGGACDTTPDPTDDRETLGEAFTGATNTEYSCYNGDNSRLEFAQSFLHGSIKPITKASFTVYRPGVGSGSFVVEIQSDKTGLPSGTVLGTSEPIKTTTLSATAAWQDFSSAAVPCVKGTTYWLVLRRVGGANIAGQGLIAKANTNSDSYKFGRLVSRATDGTWQETSNDALFRTYVK